MNLPGFFLILSFARLCYCTIHCLDDDGNPVDWFVLNKLPKIKEHSNYNIAYGTAYTYITSNTKEEGWRLSDYNISDPLSSPGRTLSMAYSKENTNTVEDIFWLLYNDAPPNETFTTTDGHAKGVLLGNQDGGIWIVHSIPHYPPKINSSKYTYPSSGHMFGQSFLCISLGRKDLDVVGNQLMVNWAHTYDYKFEGNLHEIYPAVFRAAKKEKVSSIQTKIQLTSSQNQTFISFAKAPLNNIEMYSKWVAVTLQAELYVESWLHGLPLPSDCDSLYHVYNIMNIEIKSSNCSIYVCNDHSKYAVSTDSTKPWICIGDINRTEDHLIRGGGTVCFKNKNVWSTYFNSIVLVQPCRGTKVKCT